MENRTFGPHLTLDLNKCNKNKLSDYNLVFNLLNELPEKIGMTKITQPYVFPYNGLNQEDSGITGIVIIAESHISLHSFIEKDYVFIDVFSCKPFDVEFAKKYFIDAFEAGKSTVNVIERGLDFPK